MSEVCMVAIDPGILGGFAWVAGDGLIQAEAMPDGMTEQLDRLRSLVAELDRPSAIVEKVGYWVPGDHPNAATKFARHCGNLEAGLYVLGVPVEVVAPSVWMRSLGALPKDKAKRKRAIKELMARRYPHLKVTLKTADALGMLTWAMARKEPNLA